MGRPRPLCWARCSLVFCVRQFCNVVATISDGNQHVDLPPPAIMFPVALWTGKQVVSMLLKQNKQTQLLVNVELKERNYSGKNAEGKEWLHMCPDEGYVCIRNRWEARRSRCVIAALSHHHTNLAFALTATHSELLCGNLGKSTLGGKKTGLVYALIRNHSEMVAAT